LEQPRDFLNFAIVLGGCDEDELPKFGLKSLRLFYFSPQLFLSYWLTKVCVFSLTLNANK